MMTQNKIQIGDCSDSYVEWKDIGDSYIAASNYDSGPTILITLKIGLEEKTVCVRGDELIRAIQNCLGLP